MLTESFDHRVECFRCKQQWPQSNNEPKACPFCGGVQFVYKHTKIDDGTHAAVFDKDRLEAQADAGEMVRKRVERAGRGRKRFFNIPKDML